ncbi:L,D-transpeptidase [Gandjariella thermophila]|nr:Ig-like domain-containing protein [Gandjariella thermophila]
MWGVLTVLIAACTGGGGPDPGPGSVRLVILPADQAAGVEPDKPVTVSATGGRLTEVVVTNPEGKRVAGEISPDGRRWTSTEPLGYGRGYTVRATGTGIDGRTATATSSFTTVKPDKQASVWINPGDNEVIGIGHPLAFTFDTPVTDKAAAERAIRIETVPTVEGAFHWFNDKELRWRPREFWKPGTKITISADVYGRNLGGGVFGQSDVRATATVGDAVVAHADGATHQMTVEVNGREVRTIPISLGRPAFPSNNGIHVVSDKGENVVMDSMTFGLAYSAGGYRTTVQWATRISNGGEYVHAAPWSVGEQGYSNVSHGCINMSTEAARWFFGLAKPGDVVIITNSGGPELQPWDGWGDWQMPWEQWIRGGDR